MATIVDATGDRPLVLDIGENTTEAKRQANIAGIYANDADGARAAAEAALAAAQAVAATLPYPNYASTADAQADTTLFSGKLYTVVADGQVQIYLKNSSSSSSLTGVIPTTPYVDRLKSRAAVPTVDYGAVGDGLSAVADQAGFSAAIAAAQASVTAPLGSGWVARRQIGIMVDPGLYDAGDYTFAGVPVLIVARVPGTVFIRVPDGKYFINHTGNLSSVLIDGVSFIGGLGAFNSAQTGGNASDRIEFNRCGFYQYTECAVGNQASDSPFLKVTKCVFGSTVAPKKADGSAGNQIIAINWSGYADELVIEDCTLGGNTYNIVIGPRLSGHISITRNYFTTTTYASARTLADIWIKPNSTDSGDTNGGHGTWITYNKFAHEEQNTAYPYPRILIANEDTSTGTYRQQWKPKLSGAGTDVGYMSGLHFVSNKIGSVSPYNAPVIRSYISNLRYWIGEKNVFVGGQPTYMVEFPNGRTSDYTNTNSRFRFDETTAGYPLRFSNATWCQLEDHASLWPGDPNAIDLYPVSDNPDLSVVASALSGYELGFTSGTTSVAAADPYGTTEYAAVTGGALIGFTDPYAGAGGRIFLELNVSRAATNSLTFLIVDVFNYTGSNFALKQTILLPPNGKPGPVKIPLVLPAHASPTTWQMRAYGSGIVSGSADTFVTGDWVITKGAGRLGKAGALARWPGATRNNRLIGGAVGTAPTGWSIATNINGLAGITVTVSRVGSDRHGYFIEVTLGGTCTSAGAIGIYTEVAKAVGMESGNLWRAFFGMRLMSGDLSSASSIAGYDGSAGPVNFSMACYSSAAALLVQRGFSFTPTTTYKLFGRTMSASFFHPSADYALPVLGLQFAVGAAPAAVLRIYPQPFQRAQ